MNKRISAVATAVKQLPTLHYWLLAAITLLAAALRLYRLGEWSFWIDEVYTVNRAKVVFENLRAWPSISELLLGGVFAWSGVDEWSARIAPAIVGVLSVPILYFPIKSLLGKQVALLSSLFLALSPWHLFWSQNGRFYTVLLLLYTLALLFFFMGLEKDRSAYIWLSAFFLTFAIRERLTALFFIPVIISYVIAIKILPLKKPAGLRLKNFAPLIVPLAIIGLREILNSAYGTQVVSTDQFADYSASARVSSIQVLFSLFVGNPGPSPFWVLSSIIENIGVPLLFLGFFTGVYWTVKKNRIGVFLLLGALVPFVGILLLSTFTYSLDRYIFISLSSWIILGAMGIGVLFQEVGKKRVIIIWGVALLFFAGYLAQDTLYFKYQNGGRADWKGAYAHVAANKSDDALIFSSQPELGRYYLDEDVHFMGDVEPESIVQDRRQAWFVDNGWINPKTMKWIQANSELTGVYDVHTPLERFTMRVYRYTPK